VSTAAPPPADPPPTEAPVPTEPPVPAVPYGGATAPDDPAVALSTSVSAEDVGRSVGGTAVKWGLRLLLPIVLRMLFRALSRR
jgi:hypothetical protein